MARIPRPTLVFYLTVRPLKNRLLAALPEDLYARVAKDLRMIKVAVGEPLVQHGVPVTDVYFPNGGVYSVTNQMKDGSLVEVATVGTEGMLGVTVFLGDLLGSGTSLQQVPDGLLPALAVAPIHELVSPAGPFRDVIARYAQANLLQIMQCTACNALHNIEQRCCRWLLQTHDRVDGDEFQLEARVPGDHARLASPHRDAGARHAAEGRSHLEQVRPHRHSQPRRPRSGVV